MKSLGIRQPGQILIFIINIFARREREKKIYQLCENAHSRNGRRCCKLSKLRQTDSIQLSYIVPRHIFLWQRYRLDVIDPSMTQYDDASLTLAASCHTNTHAHHARTQTYTNIPAHLLTQLSDQFSRSRTALHSLTDIPFGRRHVSVVLITRPHVSDGYVCGSNRLLHMYTARVNCTELCLYASRQGG